MGRASGRERGKIPGDDVEVKKEKEGSTEIRGHAVSRADR